MKKLGLQDQIKKFYILGCFCFNWLSRSCFPGLRWPGQWQRALGWGCWDDVLLPSGRGCLKTQSERRGFSVYIIEAATVLTCPMNLTSRSTALRNMYNLLGERHPLGCVCVLSLLLLFAILPSSSFSSFQLSPSLHLLFETGSHLVLDGLYSLGS